MLQIRIRSNKTYNLYTTESEGISLKSDSEVPYRLENLFRLIESASSEWQY